MFYNEVYTEYFTVSSWTDVESCNWSNNVKMTRVIHLDFDTFFSAEHCLCNAVLEKKASSKIGCTRIFARQA